MRGAWIAGLLVAGLLAGCGKPDREAILIGRWSPSELAAPALGFKLSQSGEGDGTVNPMAAAWMITAIALELRKDKTFVLKWQRLTLSGAWTFDEESGQVSLNIARIDGFEEKGNNAPVQPPPPAVWTATLDPDNTRLRFFPGVPGAASLAGQAKGPLSDGIPLKKEEP